MSSRKKYFKTIIALCCIFSFCFQITVGAAVRYSSSFEDSFVPSEAKQYLREHYADIVQLVKDYKDDFQLNEANLYNIRLGEPYVILKLDTSQQDEIYYYPLIDASGKVIVVISVMGTTEGWRLSFSMEMASELNEIDYGNHKYLFYESNETLVAWSEESEVALYGNTNDGIASLSEDQSFEEQFELFQDKIRKQFVKTDLSIQDTDFDTELLMEYTPKFSRSDSLNKLMELNNPQGQGTYQICWAACVATIVNYRNGTNYTAKDICDRMGTGYVGAGSSTAANALSGLGVPITKTVALPDVLSWSKVEANIGSKYPIYLGATGIDSQGVTQRHAVAIVGYQKLAASNVIVFWNPGINNGNGGTEITFFESSATTYVYGNITWKWLFTISHYT